MDCGMDESGPFLHTPSRVVSYLSRLLYPTLNPSELSLRCYISMLLQPIVHADCNIIIDKGQIRPTMGSASIYPDRFIAEIEIHLFSDGYFKSFVELYLLKESSVAGTLQV